jgi:hypothetical protein
MKDGYADGMYYYTNPKVGAMAGKLATDSKPKLECALAP